MKRQCISCRAYQRRQHLALVSSLLFALVVTIGSLLSLTQADTLVNLIPPEDLGVHVIFEDRFFQSNPPRTFFTYRVTTQAAGCRYELREGTLVTPPENPFNPLQSFPVLPSPHLNYPRSGILSANDTDFLRSPEIREAFLNPQFKTNDVKGSCKPSENGLFELDRIRERCNGALAVLIGSCNLLSNVALARVSPTNTMARFSDFPYPALYGIALLIDQDPGTTRTYTISLEGEIPLQLVDAAAFSHPLTFPFGRALLNAAIQQTEGPGCPVGCPVGYRLTQAGCVPQCANCVNGFCVRPDECRCSPGFTGTNCELALAPGPCPDGFFFDCQTNCHGFQCFPRCCCLPSCPAPNICGLNEVCISPGRCVCATGFHREIGENATSSDILLNQCVPTCDCCIHGTCVAPDFCLCDPGWTGRNCDIRIANVCPIGFAFINGICVSECDRGCIHGRCVGPNQCECKRGFTGPRCETPICDPVCLNFGICVAPNFCLCPPFLIGRQCEQFLTCPNCPQCNPTLPAPPPPPEPGCRHCPSVPTGHGSSFFPLCCGNRCFDPETQRCTSERVVCGLFDESCNGLCYDTRRYTCIDGELFFGQPDQDRNNPTPPPDDEPQKLPSSGAMRTHGETNWLVMLCALLVSVVWILV